MWTKMAMVQNLGFLISVQWEGIEQPFSLQLLYGKWVEEKSR